MIGKLSMGKREKYFDGILKFVSDSVDNVFKSPNVKFKHPFIDPGSIYEGNLWDWDSFWTVYSLTAYQQITGDEEFKQRLIEGAQGNVLNFFEFQMEDGYIPMMVTYKNQYINEDEHTEPYLITKHKEGEILNMHKPFLCQQACLVSGLKESFDWLKEYVGNLEKYFECYDRYYFNDNCKLYVWADDVMIGMDNDPASFGRPRFSTANVFLNSFLVMEFKSMAKILTALGDSQRAEYYIEKAEDLSKAMQEECYDPKDKFFYSVDVDIKTRAYDWFHKGLGVFWKTLPIKIQTWTGFIPMYASIATDEQSENIMKLHIQNPETFESDFGIRALAKDEKMYNLEATNNPSNWLGPIWLIVNYVTFRALMNYGYKKEAQELYEKTLSLLGSDYEKTGTLHEYYSPETGQPVMSPGFLNWNLLVINMKLELEGDDLSFGFIS